jgi:hypothetical protein
MEQPGPTAAALLAFWSATDPALSRPEPLAVTS